MEIPEEPGAFLKLHNHIHPRSVTEFSYRYGNEKKAQILLSFMLNGTKAPAPAAGEAPSTGAVPIPEGISATTANSTANSSTAAGAQGSNSLASSVASLSDSLAATASLSSSSGTSELETILRGLADDGMTAIDISGDEVSKSHLRYLVGGKTSVPNERIFRFEFPERPGALRKFLVGMQSGWNVSLFHYRNHGADVGKILLGIQAPKEDNAKLETFLKELGYMYHEETDNPVIRRYLGATA